MLANKAVITVGTSTIMANDVSRRLCRLWKFLFCEIIVIVTSNKMVARTKIMLAVAAAVLFCKRTKGEVLSAKKIMITITREDRKSVGRCWRGIPLRIAIRSVISTISMATGQ